MAYLKQGRLTIHETRLVINSDPIQADLIESGIFKNECRRPLAFEESVVAELLVSSGERRVDGQLDARSRGNTQAVRLPPDQRDPLSGRLESPTQHHNA